MLTQASYALICVNTTSNYKMFGSVLRAKVLERPFVMAFKDAGFKSYKIYYAKANNDAQLVSQIQTMTTNKCSIILGIFTSQDCLVSGPVLAHNHTIGVSSSCSDNKIQRFYPYIHTSVPHLSTFSKVVANYVNKHKNGKIYAFYQPADPYSQSGYQAFKQYAKRHFVSIPVGLYGNINLPQITAKPGRQNFFIFFTYPLPSAQILVQLETHGLINKSTNIIGASSWIFDESVFRPIVSIFTKAKRVLTPNLIRRSNITSSKFAHKFMQRYKRPPDVVEVLTYDTTRLSVNCYRRANAAQNFNAKLFLSCLANNKYQGISGRTIFPNGSAFAQRKVYLVNFKQWF